MNMNKRTSPARVDDNFIRELKEIKVERIRRGLDKELKSDRRLTKAMIRSSIWKDLKLRLINSPMEDD